MTGVGAVVFAAVVGLAYWLFKLFSEKCITAKFNERLEDYKHQHHKELEELWFKINSLMDRTTKLYQREFDVLPEAWGKLVIAHGHVQAVATGLQQYPDLDRMSSQQLAEFLDKCPLDNWEKEKIKGEGKKSDFDRFVVMPNHLHSILVLPDADATTRGATTRVAPTPIVGAPLVGAPFRPPVWAMSLAHSSRWPRSAISAASRTAAGRNFAGGSGNATTMSTSSATK